MPDYRPGRGQVIDTRNWDAYVAERRSFGRRFYAYCRYRYRYNIVGTNSIFLIN